MLVHFVRPNTFQPCARTTANVVFSRCDRFALTLSVVAAKFLRAFGSPSLQELCVRVLLPCTQYASDRTRYRLVVSGRTRGCNDCATQDGQLLQLSEGLVQQKGHDGLAIQRWQQQGLGVSGRA